MNQVLDAIERRQVSLVIFSTDLAWRQDLVEGLENLGCVRTGVYEPVESGEFEGRRCTTSDG